MANLKSVSRPESLVACFVLIAVSVISQVRVLTGYFEATSMQTKAIVVEGIKPFRYQKKQSSNSSRFGQHGTASRCYFLLILDSTGPFTANVTRVFLFQSNKCLERLHCHEPRGVSCLTSATEGQRRLLCTGSYDSTITIRDFKVKRPLRH